MSRNPEEYLRGGIKRALDVSAALATLPITVPTIGAAALAERITDGSPCFFSQKRLGRDGELFTMHKIRSMPTEVDPYVSSQWPLDPRATRLGRFLRRYSIDELPQLPTSVLGGTMSVVGPRPKIPSVRDEMMDDLSPTEQYQLERAGRIAKPGLFDQYTIDRREKGGSLPPAYRAHLEIKYSQTASLEVDLRIISQVVRGELRGVVDALVEVDGVKRFPVLLAESLGVVLRDDEMERLTSMCDAARLIDSLIDEQGCLDTSEISEKASLINGSWMLNYERSVRYIKMLADQNSEFLKQCIDDTIENAKKKKRATQSGDLYVAVVAEVDILHRLFALEPGEGFDRIQRRRYNQLLRDYLYSGYMCDVALDMADDYRNGECGVPPTLSDRIKFMRKGVISGIRFLGQIPNDAKPAGIKSALRYSFRLADQRK